MQGSLLPSAYLARAGKVINNVWKKVDAYRVSPPAGMMRWNPCLFMPLDGWMRIIKEFRPGIEDEKRYALALLLSTAGAWRPGQDMVRFDSDFQAMLVKTPITGELPTTIISRFPAWSIWFDTGPMVVNEHEFRGFFASLEEDEKRTQLFMRLLFLDCSGNNLPVLVPLGAWTLERAMVLANRLTRRVRAEKGLYIDEEKIAHIDSGIHAALNLVLYVCSLDNDRQEAAAFSIPQAKKTRHKGWRLFPPAKPRIHFFGNDFGESYRKFCAKNAAEIVQRAGPSPHIRKAHWHGYWSGPRKGERKFDLKWLPPIPVAMRDDNDDGLQV